MKSTSILGAACGLLLITLGATAGTVPLNISNYNFALAGGGGGASATLNGVPVQIYCDDFANEIYLPSSNSANITTLGTGANLSETRFGGVSSTGWTTITLSDGNSALDTTDDSFFNNPGSGSTALARYEMAAYLVSVYNPSLGGNTSNNQIQEAIWTIMDPKTTGAVIDPSGVNPDTYLEQAVTWYSSMNAPGQQGALNTFLARFEIVSASNMSYTSGLGVGGFQEQLVMTPEPRGGLWLLFFLMLSGFAVMRRTSGTNPASQLQEHIDGSARP